MPTKSQYQVKQLQKKAYAQLVTKASRRLSSTSIKQWSLTYINNTKAQVGASTTIEAKDYIQALEHALYAAGFFLEKQTSETKI
jgi:hypothetical protein